MDYIEIHGTPVFASIKKILNKLEVETGKIGRVKDTGNNYMIVCPFHDDTDPSLGISKKASTNYSGEVIPAGTVNCFGCEYSGDLIKFIADIKEVTEHQAFKWLINNFTVGEYEKRKIDLDFLEGQKDGDFESFISELDIYHSYMEFRGFTPEIILKYEIKYNPKNDTIVFPVYNQSGDKVIGYQERGVDGKSFYSEGNVNTLFGRQHLEKDANEVWLTEGPIDALITKKFGHNAVAIMGGLSDQKLSAIGKLPYRVFICAFDNDKAGDKFSRIVADKFKNRLVKRAFFKTGDDPGDMKDEFKYDLKYMV